MPPGTSQTAKDQEIPWYGSNHVGVDDIKNMLVNSLYILLHMSCFNAFNVTWIILFCWILNSFNTKCLSCSHRQTNIGVLGALILTILAGCNLTVPQEEVVM